MTAIRWVKQMGLLKEKWMGPHSVEKSEEYWELPKRGEPMVAHSAWNSERSWGLQKDFWMVAHSA